MLTQMVTVPMWVVYAFLLSPGLFFLLLLAVVHYESKWRSARFEKISLHLRWQEWVLKKQFLIITEMRRLRHRKSPMFRAPTNGVQARA